MARHIVPDGTAGINVGDVIALLVDEKSGVGSPDVAAYKVLGSTTQVNAAPTPPEVKKGRVESAVWLDRCGPAARVAYLGLPAAQRDAVLMSLIKDGILLNADAFHD